MQLAAFDLLVQAPRTDRLRAYLPELFTRYREVIQEQIDRLEADGRVTLLVEREVLVPLVLNTVLGFGLYYVVTRDDDSCVRALSAFGEPALTAAANGRISFSIVPDQHRYADFSPAVAKLVPGIDDWSAPPSSPNCLAFPVQRRRGMQEV